MFEEMREYLVINEEVLVIYKDGRKIVISLTVTFNR